MIDTVRLVIDWRCNKDCSYCCNNIPELRRQFKHVFVDDIPFHKYKTICLTGGEPLLCVADTVYALAKAKRWNSSIYAVLNTNGTLLTRKNARLLEKYGLDAINVGLHDPKDFKDIVKKCNRAVKGTGIKIRYNVQDCYEDDLRKKFPGITIKAWRMNECDRDNEDRYTLTDPQYYGLTGSQL